MAHRQSSLPTASHSAVPASRAAAGGGALGACRSRGGRVSQAGSWR
jgi:hypothetical protein